MFISITRHKLLILSVLLILLLGVVPTSAARENERVVITWFVGLGTGGTKEQIEAQQHVVADFNASQDHIQLELYVASAKGDAYDLLGILLSSGNAPDIVGPVGFFGANSFAAAWLDLEPLIAARHYDLSVYPENFVKLYRAPEGLLGIPFATYPSFIYYNQALFDEAGLNYPPQAFGAAYIMPDGTAVEWNYDTLLKIGKLLTIDINGNDATSPAFNPTRIVQFGFDFTWLGIRSIFALSGGANLWDAETKTVTIPQHWRAMTHWYWDGMWKDHFIPNTVYRSSDILANYQEFASGNLAIALSQLWYTCCADAIIDSERFQWAIAVVPSYEGRYYAPTDVDSFRIMKASTHPDEAFTALSYILDQGTPILTTVYGAYPARLAYRQDFLEGLTKRYPKGINWQIAEDSLKYTVEPHHEADHPNFKKGEDRLGNFQALIESDQGKYVNLDAEIDKLEADLQIILNEK